MKRAAVSTFLLLTTLASPVAAMTNRELLAQQPAFGAFYVAGVAGFVMDLQIEGESDEAFTSFNDCMREARLSPLTMYNRVLEWVATHPQDLDRPVATAVLNTIDQICYAPVRPAHPNDQPEATEPVDAQGGELSL